MSNKTLSIRNVAQLKKTAQIVSPMVLKKQSIQAKIDELNAELTVIDAQIEGWEGGTKAMTGGFTSEDLIQRTVVTVKDNYGVVKKDKNGNPVKRTIWEPKEGALEFDKENNVYNIIIAQPSSDVKPADVEDPTNVVEQHEDNDFDPTAGAEEAEQQD